MTKLYLPDTRGSRGAGRLTSAGTPVDAPPPEQQAALERLAANLRADVALFAADGTPLAAVGAALPAPDPGRDRGGWLRAWGAPAGVIHLRDGRWLAARVRSEHRPARASLFFTLVLLALAVGVGAYPVVRRLTARLERLQRGVESLGAGNLSARVRVEGRDEGRGSPRASITRRAGSRSWWAPTRRSSPMPPTSCARRSRASAWRWSC